LHNIELAVLLLLLNADKTRILWLVMVLLATLIRVKTEKDADAKWFLKVTLSINAGNSVKTLNALFSWS
jgi:hypothetical protein